jgi:hypothetical protein
MTSENMARNLRNAFHAHELLVAWEYMAEDERVRWRRVLERARQMFGKCGSDVQSMPEDGVAKEQHA